MEGAANYGIWREAAMSYDKEAGLEEWKFTDASPFYDFKLIQRRLAQILGAREGGYLRRLMFILQEGLHGNLGNISNPMLYRFTRFGTKRLIEHYLDEVCESLDWLCDEDSDEFTLAEKIEFFEATSQTFGQSSLMLSGGAALGIYHMGVVKSLWENGLLPHVISGSSAGSIVAAMLGTHSDEELREVMAHRESLVGLIKWNSPPRTHLFDVEHFNAKLRERIGEMSFQEAFRRSGRAINITVSAYDPLDEGRLLNYRTSPNVVINSAPLAFMRGRTLNHAFIILDEAQNTTPEQMKMFLTRIGIGAKAVVTGDLTQIDLPKGHKSGLREARDILQNVRGLFIYLEHSIDRSTQWAVFEPNNEELWLKIRRTIEGFLYDVWRTGALLGARPEDAYFVRCDRSTMSQSDLDNGRMVCLIGVAPTKPAEFVIFRIGQWTADASIV